MEPIGRSVKNPLTISQTNLLISIRVFEEKENKKFTVPYFQSSQVTPDKGWVLKLVQLLKLRLMNSKTLRKTKKSSRRQRKKAKQYNPYCTYPDCNYKSMNSTRLKRHIQAHQTQELSQESNPQPIEERTIAKEEMAMRVEPEDPGNGTTDSRQHSTHRQMQHQQERMGSMIDYLKATLVNAQQETNYLKTQCLAQQIYQKLEPVIRMNLVPVLRGAVRNAIEVQGYFSEYEEVRFCEKFLQDFGTMLYPQTNPDRNGDQHADTKLPTVSGVVQRDGQTSEVHLVKHQEIDSN